MNEATVRDACKRAFDLIAAWVDRRIDDWGRLAATGRSFEQWINWELFLAAPASGFEATPEYRYASLGVSAGNERADIMLLDPTSGVRVVIEVALVQANTSGVGWRDKINWDTDRLARIPSEDVGRLQIVLQCSHLHKPAECANWSKWFASVRIGTGFDFERRWALPPTGQCWLVGRVVPHEPVMAK